MLQEKNKKRKGATIVEMLVYAALFGLVFTGIYMVFNASIKYYHVTKSNIWVQQASLNAINQLSRELFESSLDSVILYSSSPKGVVFMSPRKTDNTVEYNSTSGYEGQPYWQKFICYYMYADPENPAKNMIYRKEIAVTPASAPYSSSTYTTSYFATGGGSGLSHKVIANDISDFDLYWMDGSIKSYGTPSDNPVYISVTAEDESIGKENTMTTVSSVDVLN
ncbi:MAG: hypothetical protein ABIH00_05935 [Armatimonadota bacterium]